MHTVNEIFKHVTFDGEDRQYSYELFTKVKALAEEIDKAAPECCDKKLAFRAMNVALMHVNNALGKKDKYKV